MDQVNSLLHHELAEALNRHLDLDGCLITVTEVICSPDLKEAKILVSVLPEKFVGTALAKLRHISGDLARDLRPRLKFKNMPTFIWIFDERLLQAAELEKVFKEIE